MPIETDAQLNRRIYKGVEAGNYSVSLDVFSNLLDFLGISKILNLESSKDHGHNPSDDPTSKPNYKRKPHNIWFYYQRMNTDGSLYVAEYVYNSKSPISNGEMKTKSKDLALNARKPLNQQNPKPSNFNYSNIKIDRVSYFVIFVDESNWEFHKIGGKPVVLFRPSDPDGNACDPNFSFFLSDTFKTRMPVSSGGSDERESLVMVNFLKKDMNGTELGSNGESKESRFFFDFPQRVKFATPDRMLDDGTFEPQVDQPRLTIMFDPGGTNLGPPKDP